jgi:putative Holliday junction resolvase
VETGAGRVAALDYGQARIGLAVSDELGLLAHPRPFVPARPLERALRDLGALFRREGIGHVLLGLPLSLGGKEGLAAGRARKFGQALGAATGVAIEYVDERLTTVTAASRLREAGHDARQARGRIDSASAAVLLQAWLDGRRPA